MQFKWITRLLLIINNYRQSYGLEPVKWSPKAYDDLEHIRITNTDKWFYDLSKNESHYVELINRTQRNNGDFIHPQGFNMLFHDTSKYLNFNNIIQHRINQDHCFDYNKCNDTKYYDNISCLKVVPPDLVYNKSKNKCIWSWYYTPRMLYNMTQIACIPLHFRTLAVPLGLDQPYSFYCYGNFQVQKKDKIL